MIDIVIPVSETNTWAFEDLRYCLRSIHKHVKGFDSIHIVTKAKLDFIDPMTTGINIIPFADDDSWKEWNIYKKIVRACKDPDITKKFLLVNDDHFFLEETIATYVPYYHQGTIEKLIYQRQGLDQYKECLINTYFELVDKGSPTKYFDVHTPMVCDKILFLAMTAVDWKGKIPGFVIKSLYANSLHIPGVPYEDAKLELMPENFYEYIVDKNIFSTGSAHSLKVKLLPYLQELYPQKSPWEL